MNQPIQITVQRGNEQHDLEVSPEITVAELREAVVAAYGWGQKDDESLEYKIQHLLEDRNLEPIETLLEARVWNGALLVFQFQAKTKPQTQKPDPKQVTAPAKQPGIVPPSSAQAPLTGWRQMDDISQLPTKDSDTDVDSGEFTWKQLD